MLLLRISYFMKGNDDDDDNDNEMNDDKMPRIISSNAHTVYIYYIYILINSNRQSESTRPRSTAV
jgi:hypothetical protein